MANGQEKGFKLFTGGTVPYLQAPVLNNNGLIGHAFSTRKGGCSKGPFASLNTGYHTGDKYDYVLENRALFMDQFAYDYRALTSSVQVHGTTVGIFSEAERGEGALPETARRQCDALVTTEPNLPLAAYSADCQLIFLAAMCERPVVALAHAGWKGTLGNITGKTVAFLHRHFAVDPEEIVAALSPAVCRNCYLIDRDLSRRFQAVGWGSQRFISAIDESNFELDLPAINTAQLIKSGVKEENIGCSRWCTSCREDLFYSYRRDNGVTGRMLGFISIKDS